MSSRRCAQSCDRNASALYLSTAPNIENQARCVRDSKTRHWLFVLSLGKNLMSRASNDPKARTWISQYICQNLPNRMNFKDIQQLSHLPHSLCIRTSSASAGPLLLFLVLPVPCVSLIHKFSGCTAQIGIYFNHHQKDSLNHTPQVMLYPQVTASSRILYLRLLRSATAWEDVMSVFIDFRSCGSLLHRTYPKVSLYSLVPALSLQ